MDGCDGTARRVFNAANRHKQETPLDPAPGGRLIQDLSIQSPETSGPESSSFHGMPGSGPEQNARRDGGFPAKAEPVAPSSIPYGPRSWLVRYAEQADEAAFQQGRSLAAGLAKAIDALGRSHLREIIPAPTSVLIDFDPAGPALDQDTVEALVAQALALPSAPEPERCREIPVEYGGPDLERVARHAGLDADAVIERHHQASYRVLCLGFAPGFPYLGGLDPALATPRLSSPRPRVPAGSVGIGGDHAGIYSIHSPGGWNLIGRTTTLLFDPHAPDLDRRFHLQAGDRVRFVPVGRSGAGTEGGWDPVSGGEATRAANRSDRTEVHQNPDLPGEPVLRVLDAGLGLGLQDGGRPGFRRFGVPAGGAMDPAAADWANRLLDNPPEAPVLELCLQGQRFEVLRDGWVAVGGPGHPRGQAPYRAFRVRAGQVLEFGPGASGVWTYLAVPGGFAGRTFLGSASTNPRAGIGLPIRPGDLLGHNEAAEWHLPAGVASRSVAPDQWTALEDLAPVRVWPGPQWDRFDADSRQRLLDTEWRVTSQCDRVGYRLRSDRDDARSGVGQPVTSSNGQASGTPPGPSKASPGPQASTGLAWHGGSILSEPVLPGSIQVPPDGQPIITLHDGPTLGGYPKIAWIDPRDLPRLVQRRPGQPVRFTLAASAG